MYFRSGNNISEHTKMDAEAWAIRYQIREDEEWGTRILQENFTQFSAKPTLKSILEIQFSFKIILFILIISELSDDGTD